MRTTESVDSGRTGLRRAALDPRDSRGVLRRILHLRPLAVAAVAVSLAVAGCGSGAGELLRQTGAAAQRNFLDLLLTGLADALAAAPDQAAESGGDGEPEADEEGQTDTPDESGDEVTGAVGLEALAGDVSTGEAVFIDNGCAACHCDDAAGGCALDASSLLAVDVAAIDENLRGEDPHPVAAELSDQDIVDLQAYLASFGP